MSATAVAKLNRLESALENAKTIEETKEIRDQAKALSDYLKKRDGHHLNQNDIAALKLRAERKLGQILKDQFPHGNFNGKKNGKPVRRSQPATLDNCKIPKSQSSRWRQEWDVPKDRFDEFEATGKANTKFELTSAALLKLAKKLKSERLAKEEGKAMAAALEKAGLPDSCNMRHCSAVELFKSEIEADAVITDPPYPEEFLPLYGDLAKACKNVPLVAVMCGQSYLPQIMALMCPHLTYRWTMCYLTPGANLRQWQKKVDCGWKPVILFGDTPKDYVFDVFESKADDKRFHGWGQSESGFLQLVERLTKPGQLVCDPFLGGGTTALCSLALGRRFVGCDIDEKAVKTSQGRIAKFLNELK